MTELGRRLLVARVRGRGRPVAQVPTELGVSRQCAHRWLTRFDVDVDGEAGLADRSSRPHHSPRRTPAEVERRVLAERDTSRRGPDWIAAELGVPARTVTRILRRHGRPRLAACDPLTGQPIRASRESATRYERDRPGQLVHMDVKKIGRIPDGGGWRAHGRAAAGDTGAHKHARTGFDYVHSVVDDHSRLAYSEILPNEQGRTCAAFLVRAAADFAGRGIGRIDEVITDNAWSYRHCAAVAAVIADLGATHRFIKPHCPWQNGKVERFNRTLQIEWAYRQVFINNAERAAALGPWLTFYNTQRRHTALGGQPPITRVLSPTS